MNGVELNEERERERGGRERDKKRKKMKGKKEGKLIGRETGFNRLKSIFHIYSYSNERQSCNLPYKFPTFTPPPSPPPPSELILKTYESWLEFFFFFFFPIQIEI